MRASTAATDGVVGQGAALMAKIHTVEWTPAILPNPVIEIAMNNSSGLFQVDELLATKLRGSGIEEHVEVVARIEAEHEKRLVPVFRI